MARRGARVVLEDQEQARPAASTPRHRPPARHEEEVWVFEGSVDEDRSERPPRATPDKGGADTRGPRPGTTPRRPGSPRPAGPKPVSAEAASAPREGAARPEGAALPADIAAELTDAVGRQQGTKLAERMAAAIRAYDRDRYQDAWRISRAVVAQVPESPAVRELHGLVSYRLSRWREAIRHLEAARALSGDDTTQLPVLMDCHRAMGHHRRVGELWTELRASSPDADVLAEGRLVLAADRADRGDLSGAIALLQSAGAGRRLRHPAERHIRQWYLLGDLFERAGDLPRAREMFARVAEADPELADAAARLAALGRRSRPRPLRSAGSRR